MDGGVDGKGRFWFGTMRNNVAPDGAFLPILESTGVLYKVEPGPRITPMEGGVGISNATCWSPDYNTMYFADTLVGAIHAYDYDLEFGAIANKRVFANPEGHGFPDGATVDAEGYVWNARWEGGSVIRFAPDGSVDAIVLIPASRVTCCDNVAVAPDRGGTHDPAAGGRRVRCEARSERAAEAGLRRIIPFPSPACGEGGREAAG